MERLFGRNIPEDFKNGTVAFRFDVRYTAQIRYRFVP